MAAALGGGSSSRRPCRHQHCQRQPAPATVRTTLTPPHHSQAVVPKDELQVALFQRHPAVVCGGQRLQAVQRRLLHNLGADGGVQARRKDL